MECVGARNLAAMAFCVSPSLRLRLRRKKLWRRRVSSSGHAVRWRSHCLKVEATAAGAGTSSESCVVTKEEFADEEDYVKAGGSELVFVQMQQKKSMEMQSKLADKSGGPFWYVPQGRRDVLVSNRTLANISIPAPTEALDTIISKFNNVGLDRKDVVTLSGSHTIGRARCASFSKRLSNFFETGAPDDTIETDTLTELQNLCPESGDGNITSVLDQDSADQFDSHYFKNLLHGKGLLGSDQILFSSEDATATTKPLV